MSDLVAGEGDPLAGRWVLDAFGGGDDGKHGVREQGSAPPGQPAADLVFIESDQAFGGLRTLLDGPSACRDADQLTERNQARGVAAVEGEFAVAAVTADQQPVVSGRGGHSDQPQS